jgi:hypothetical protein
MKIMFGFAASAADREPEAVRTKMLTRAARSFFMAFKHQDAPPGVFSNEAAEGSSSEDAT